MVKKSLILSFCSIRYSYFQCFHYKMRCQRALRGVPLFLWFFTSNYLVSTLLLWIKTVCFEAKFHQNKWTSWWHIKLIVIVVYRGQGAGGSEGPMDHQFRISLVKNQIHPMRGQPQVAVRLAGG